MKIKHLFGLAVIAAMTASCSSNEDLGTAGPGTGTNEAGVGYATFTINLPSVSGTRAVDAGGAEVNPGTEDEYKVSDATALIFQKYGADEGSYKFVESVNLPVTGAWEDAEEGVTKSKKLVAKLTNVDTKNQYYVLVLLNNNKTGGVKVDLPSVGDSYNEWNSKILTPKVDDLAASGDFYMANAPLNKAGSVTTLVTIDQDNIYPTQKAAENGTAAADVYVERGVAKMTVADPGTITVKDKATSTETQSQVTFSNWALDITNKKTFAVHNIDGLSLSKNFPAIWTTARFTGTNNRVYWGKDPNYDKDELKLTDETGESDKKRKDEFNSITATSEINKDFINATSTNPVYCLENTFNLANMYQGQTTRVIFKATYTPKDDKGNSLADEGGTFYTIGNMKTILKETDLEAAVTAAATSALSGCTVDYTRFKTEEGSHVITLADIKDADGKPLVAGTDYSGKTGTVIVDEINTKLGLKAGRPEEMVGINTYLKGVTYYIARVKHFGDALTKWNSGESYSDNNKQYLGRYGMLRNNWYELTVGNVYGPGYPGVPPVDPTLPDDENEKYLSVSVKILSWAKRSQSVDL